MDEPKPLSQEQAEKYVTAAKKKFEKEGTLEFDDDPTVSWVSPEEGGDKGAYVSCWVWVADEDSDD